MIYFPPHVLETIRKSERIHLYLKSSSSRASFIECKIYKLGFPMPNLAIILML